MNSKRNLEEEIKKYLPIGDYEVIAHRIHTNNVGLAGKEEKPRNRKIIYKEEKPEIFEKWISPQEAAIETGVPFQTIYWRMIHGKIQGVRKLQIANKKRSKWLISSPVKFITKDEKKVQEKE